jgi:hypothetical protein
MVGSDPDTRSSRAWQLAGEQHGVVTRAQLLALGFGKRSIEHRLASGRLHRIGRGVYAVGWPQLSRERRWMMVDLATELSRTELERAVNDADKRDVIHVGPLREALDLYAGKPGVSFLRELIDALTFRLSDSELEVRFRPIAGAAGLPQPLTKQRLNGYEVDFYWPELGLVVETDGARFHRTPSAQTRDARRDRAHVLAGMTPLRFTHHEVRYERRLVQGALSAAARLLRSRIRI